MPLRFLLSLAIGVLVAAVIVSLVAPFQEGLGGGLLATWLLAAPLLLSVYIGVRWESRTHR